MIHVLLSGFWTVMLFGAGILLGSHLWKAFQQYRLNRAIKAANKRIEQLAEEIAENNSSSGSLVIYSVSQDAIGLFEPYKCLDDMRVMELFNSGEWVLIGEL